MRGPDEGNVGVMRGGFEEKKPQKMVRSSIACARCRRSKVKCEWTIRFNSTKEVKDVGAFNSTLDDSMPLEELELQTRSLLSSHVLSSVYIVSRDSC